MQKSHVVIDEKTDQILNGYIMGDGYVSPEGNLTVDQGEEQLKFVEWLLVQFKPLCTPDRKISRVLRSSTKVESLSHRSVLSTKVESYACSPPLSRGGDIKSKNKLVSLTRSKAGPLKGKQSSSCHTADDTGLGNVKKHYSFRFNTRNVLKEYRAKWYPDGKKRLPTNIEQMFTPLFISVWFACDGTKVIGSRGAKIDVTAFTFEEREVLKQLFKQKHGIESVINRQGESKVGNKQAALVINAAAYDDFRALITSETDLIQSLFPYKLHPLTKK